MTKVIECMLKEEDRVLVIQIASSIKDILLSYCFRCVKRWIETATTAVSRNYIQYYY